MAPRKDAGLLLDTLRAYIGARMEELADAPIRLHRLDGPPGAPRYSASAECCDATECPYGIAADDAAAGRCAVHACPLRRSMRLLLDGQGAVIQEQRSNIHWS